MNISWQIKEQYILSRDLKIAIFVDGVKEDLLPFLSIRQWGRSSD